MDNQLSKYLNKDLKGAIKSLTVVQGTAKDSGNVYYAIEIEFINSYKKRLFLRNDEAFAWCNAFDLIDMDKVVESAF